MKREERAGRITRILVAVDDSPPSLEALDAAVELAASLRAELLGLYVEDINLLRLADSPFAQEVGLFSGSIRELDAQRLQRQLRAQANRVRRRLSRLAERSKIRWSFRVARGSIDTELLSAASDVDLVILGRIGWSGGRRLGSTAQAMASQTPRPTLIHAPRAAPKPAILVVYDGSEIAQRALSTATDLVQVQRGFLSVAIVAADHENARHLQIEVALWLRSRDLQARYRWLFDVDKEKVKQLMEAEGECMLVLPGSMLAGESLVTLLHGLKCPVMVVH
jgi:nucleotide-binding universal stress UspA family protein